MHAFLIASQSPEKTEESINNILNLHKAKRLDFPIQKIIDVRDLKDFTKTSLGEKTAIVVDNFSEASEDAQNALLKSLEEPQKNVIFILLSRSLGGILPTILSRCELIEIQDNKDIVDNKGTKVAVEFLESTVGQRLATVTKIKDRQEAVEFLNNLISVGHKQLIESEFEPQKLTEIDKCIQAIKANGNIQLQLTNMIVKLNK